VSPKLGGGGHSGVPIERQYQANSCAGLNRQLSLCRSAPSAYTHPVTEQDTQCTYNATSRRVRATTVEEGKQ
jgi:hypothetical protein